MKNEKLLSQELILIDQLLESVDTQEEYDCLVTRAQHICPFWVQPSERSVARVDASYSMLKGGAM